MDCGAMVSVRRVPIQAPPESRRRSAESRVALSRLPPEPVPPRVFIHDTVPALFSELELRAVERELELKVGVVLRDDGGRMEGGAWTLHLVQGELGIADGRADDCDVTILQAVDDWRSAFWEGRPRLVADLVEAIDEARPQELRSIGDANRPHNPDALRELAEIRGRIDAVIPGDGAGDEDHDEWRLAIVVGPGPIPETADATIRLGADEAEAMRRGALHPVEALITGQLRLEGDLGLIIRLQAIALSASMPPSKPPKPNV